MLIVRLVGTFIILSIIYENYKKNKKESSMRFLLTIIRKHIVIIICFSLLILLSIFTNPVSNLMKWGIMYLYIFIKNVKFFDDFFLRLMTVFNALLAINILNGT